MLVNGSRRPGGELLEITTPDGVVVIEIRCNHPAYLDQCRRLAASVCGAEPEAVQRQAMRLERYIASLGEAPASDVC